MPITALPPLADPRPFLAPLFADHAVVQRDRPLPVWGWDLPGTRVEVRLAGHVALATAGADGRWEATLPALPAGGPHRLQVQGTVTVVREDLLVGEVWLCSGQSNMEQGVTLSAEKDAVIPGAAIPDLRLAMVQHRTSLDPAKDVDLVWRPSSPATVVEGGWGGFSAVALAFGAALRERLGVPVGLVQSAWGGSRIEAWIGLDHLAASPLNRAEAEEHRAALAQLRTGDEHPWRSARSAWWTANDQAGEAGRWAEPDADLAGWGTVAVPTGWERSDPPQASVPGIFWFRRDVIIPDDWAGHGATLHLACPDHSDQTFMDGRLVGMQDGSILPRAYRLAPGTLQPGRRTLALRVAHDWGVAIWGGADQVRLERDDGAVLPLAGAWRYRVSRLGGGTFPRYAPRNMHAPTILVHSLIAPLAPYALRGALWYQGESNIGRHDAYREALAAMIADWRERFRDPAMPVGVVQLAGWLPSGSETGAASTIARLREVQAPTPIPGTFWATALDVGEPRDVHPPRKVPVGRRLARGALAVAYGRTGPEAAWTGPRLVSATRRGAAMVVHTEGAQGGLRLRPADPASPHPPGFSLAGTDQVFHPAQVAIEGADLVVTAAAVPEPVAVRYAWGDHPQCPVEDHEGLPALPWRSDGW